MISFGSFVKQNMDLKWVSVLTLLLFLCHTSKGAEETRNKRPGSVQIESSSKRPNTGSSGDCVWEEDLCNRARPLFINPDASDGTYATLYSPYGHCATQNTKCAKMRVPNGKRVIAACTGKNSELLRRKSTFAVSTCQNGIFVDAQGQRAVNSPVTEDSCTKDQKTELTLIQQVNNQLKPFVLNFLVKEGNTIKYKVKILDGIVDNTWNSLFTRASQSPSINSVACTDRKDNFVTFSTFNSNVADSYGDNVWYKNVMKSTCKLRDQQVSSLSQSDVIAKMYPSRGSTALDVKKKYSYRLIKGHLTANRDFSFKHQQDATFTYFNVAPQWQSVNVGPWSVVEDKVRKAAQDAGETIKVLTGTQGTLELPLSCGTDQNNNNVDNVPITTYGGTYRLPKLFWKLYHKARESLTQATVLIAFNTINNDALQSDGTYRNVTKNCESLAGGIFSCQYKRFEEMYNSNCQAGSNLQGLIRLLQQKHD